MSVIATSYIKNTNKIYDSASDLQRLAKDKADSLRTLTNFSECIAKNFVIFNPFKNISDDICQIIDSRNFDTIEISLKFDQVKRVNELANQIKNITESKRFLTNVQVAEFEKLIKDCFNNMAFSTISIYKTKLEAANKQMWKFIYLHHEQEQMQEEQRRKEEEEQRKSEGLREQRRAEEQSKRWQSQGLCRYCGDKFSGFFSKKCSCCGKAKDY